MAFVVVDDDDVRDYDSHDYDSRDHDDGWSLVSELCMCRQTTNVCDRDISELCTCVDRKRVWMYIDHQRV